MGSGQRGRTQALGLGQAPAYQECREIVTLGEWTERKDTCSRLRSGTRIPGVQGGRHTRGVDREVGHLL